MSNFLWPWQDMDHDDNPQVANTAVLVALIQGPFSLLSVMQSTAPSLSRSKGALIRYDLEHCS